MSNSDRSKLIRGFLFIGMMGLAVCVIHYGWHPKAFLRGYLPACLFWAGIPPGALALSMIHRLTGGTWGRFIQPELHAAIATLPLTGLLFLPLLLGLDELYPWAAPDASMLQVVQKKTAYLNVGFFRVREIAVLLIWILLGLGLRVWTMPPRAQGDGTADGWSAVGLIAYGLTMTVFGVDWIMSLEPRWSSSSFGFLMMTGPLVAALAFAIIVACTPSQIETMPDPQAASARQDLGNLLLAGVLLWTYLEFQQYLAIWYENLPEGLLWYQARNQYGWQWITRGMTLGYSALPFALLLSRPIKRQRTTLRAVATIVLAGNVLNMYWLTGPSYYGRPTDFCWLDPAAFIGIGGLWLATSSWWLDRLRISASQSIPHE